MPGPGKGTGGRKIVSAVCLPGGPADVMGVTKRRIAGVGGTEGQRLPGTYRRRQRNHRVAQAVLLMHLVLTFAACTAALSVRGHGLSHERRRHHPVAAVPPADMDRAVGCVGTRRNRALQAALDATLVFLRFRLRSRGLAPHRAGDNPCISCSFAGGGRFARGPATGAQGRFAGPARGKQRAIVSKLDSRAQAQIARRDRSPPLCL